MPKVTAGLGVRPRVLESQPTTLIKVHLKTVCCAAGTFEAERGKTSKTPRFNLKTETASLCWCRRAARTFLAQGSLHQPWLHFSPLASLGWAVFWKAR